MASGPDEATSIYPSGVADDYVRFRGVPQPIVDLIAQEARIDEDSRVLDLATGTGSLAIGLSKHSRNVIGLDISAEFLAAARAEATRLDLPARFVQESCNRLGLLGLRADVVTISQAFDWLDRTAAARGIASTLSEDGSLFIVEAQGHRKATHPFRMFLDTLPADNPLRAMLLARDVSDTSAKRRFEEAVALYRRLFEVACPSARLVPTGVWLFRQERPFSLGYMRAFWTTPFEQKTGLERSVLWERLEALFEHCRSADLDGTNYWMVLKIGRLPTKASPDIDAIVDSQFVDIAYEGCTD